LQPRTSTTSLALPNEAAHVRALAKILQGNTGATRGNDAATHSRTEAGMKSILDPNFRYTSSANTDIRKTFARVRREMRRQAQSSTRQDGEGGAVKVTPIFRSQRPAA
jgi:hypothetical protein